MPEACQRRGNSHSGYAHTTARFQLIDTYIRYKGTNITESDCGVNPIIGMRSDHDAPSALGCPRAASSVNIGFRIEK